MRVLAFAASLRAGSRNRRLIALAAAILRDQGAEVDLADFHEFDVPLYDGDVQARDGVPAGAVAFAERIAAAAGLVIASPEYNYSLPGTLKNLIDWVSRIRPVPLRGKSCFLLSASPNRGGGVQGLWQLRIPLEGLGVFVHPGMFVLPWADQAYAESGGLTEPERQTRLETMLGEYLEMTRRVAAGG